MRTKGFIMLSLTVAFLILLSACEKEAAPYAPNYDIQYTTYDYDLSTEFGNNDIFEIQNFTKTSNASVRTQEADNKAWYAAGWKILKTTDDWHAFVSLEDEWKELHHRFLLEYITERQYRNRYAEAQLLCEGDKTAELVFDSRFFDNHNLLLVDLCYCGATKIHLRPENLTVAGNQITLDVCYGGTLTSTGSNSGEICLIPIPKACDTASVNIIYMPEWVEVYNPME